MEFDTNKFEKIFSKNYELVFQSTIGSENRQFLLPTKKQLEFVEKLAMDMSKEEYENTVE